MMVATGHRDTCTCADCLVADMNQHLQEQGIDPSKYQNPHADAAHEAPRTRYAKPGQASGPGYVRRANEKQIRFLKRLLEERDTSKLIRLPGSEDIDNISARGASDLIDRLLACPKRQDYIRMANEQQLGFIRSLVARKGTDQVKLDRLNELTWDQASLTIETLKGLPDAPREQALGLEPAIYLVDGAVYKVQRAVHGSGRLYAKRLNPETAQFVYEAGAIHKIRPEHRMTLEQAKEFGAIYGICCSCGATLTDEKSIEAGIGPWCAKKFK